MWYIYRGSSKTASRWEGGGGGGGREGCGTFTEVAARPLQDGKGEEEGEGVWYIYRGTCSSKTASRWEGGGGGGREGGVWYIYRGTCTCSSKGGVTTPTLLNRTLVMITLSCGHVFRIPKGTL